MKQVDKIHMLRDLENEGFIIPVFTTKHGSDLNDVVLTNYLNQRRKITKYEIDGVVIDVNSSSKRDDMNPTRDTLNPAYAIKYKVADASNYAEVKVTSVVWSVSKHGYLKPVIYIEPTELVGVTVSKCTGFNAKFINDNGVGPGAIIAIQRSGDVIPFCSKVIETVSPQMPDVEWEWNETEVDAIATHKSDAETIEQIIDFFASIGAPHLREGNVVKLYDEGYTTTESIITATESDLVDIIGENGKKIYAGLREKLTNIPLSTLMGSTNFFGRGVGKRKFKSLIKQIGEGVYTADTRQIEAAEGFDSKTAAKIAGGIGPYLDWVIPLEDKGYITIDYEEVDRSTADEDSPIAGKTCVFTGVRDKQLEARVEELGGDIKSSVSSKTDYLVAANPNSNSGKMKKARDAGVTVMGIDEFKELIG